ncbi:MAG: hypothetical protein OXC37_05745 [Bdellovibrionaceae bacterium]|nr:hypothetical protein [Pseudobdellovibrionaceae bacterium]
MENKIPLLFSEKVILAAKSYSLSADPFVGLITSYLKSFVDINQLNLAYQKITKAHTSFNLYFKRTEDSINFEKEKLVPSSSDIKIFTNKKSLLLWQKTPLSDFPLQEMAFYKSFFHRRLFFKFHHLILDGRSVFHFFNDLSEIYLKLSSLNQTQLSQSNNNQMSSSKSSLKNLQIQKENEFKTYKKVMESFAIEEKTNQAQKINFWKNQIRNFKKEDKSSDNQIPKCAGMREQNIKEQTEFQTDFKELLTNSKKHNFHIKLNPLDLKKLAQIQKKTDIKLPYILFSIYSKSLKETFKINNLILKIAFSARDHLTEVKEKKVIASLSRSMPLFIPNKEILITEQALNLQKQIKQIKKFLILDKAPLDFNELKSYSKLKDQFLNFSISYILYKEKNFIGKFKSFSYQSFFLDLSLFLILTEKDFSLSFSYNPYKFSKPELKKLSKEFSKQIKLL